MKKIRIYRREEPIYTSPKNKTRAELYHIPCVARVVVSSIENKFLNSGYGRDLFTFRPTPTVYNFSENGTQILTFIWKGNEAGFRRIWDLNWKAQTFKQWMEIWYLYEKLDMKAMVIELKESYFIAVMCVMNLNVSMEH